MQDFEEREKPEFSGKYLSGQRGEPEQIQPKYDAKSGNQTQATLMGGECSDHYTTN